MNLEEEQSSATPKASAGDILAAWVFYAILLAVMLVLLDGKSTPGSTPAPDSGQLATASSAPSPDSAPGIKGRKY